jgi:hypothetical protein
MMKRPVWKKVILTFFIIVIASIMGIVFGNLITPDARSVARGKSWTSLGTPPEAAVKIAGESACGQSYEAVVQSASGKYYLYCSSEWEPFQSENGGPGNLAACQGNPPTQYSPAFEALPFPVRDCGLKFTNEWAIEETVYTVLEDGSVWKWDFTYGFNTILKYWIGGLIFGLIVGILLSIYVWRSGRP